MSSQEWSPPPEGGAAPVQDTQFPKAARILAGSDFRGATASGRKQGGRFFLLFTLETPRPHARLGLTVSRKVGKAVVRNRVKRQMREFFRLRRPVLPSGRDWVLIARPQAGTATAEMLRQDLQKLFSPFSRPP